MNCKNIFAPISFKWVTQVYEDASERDYVPASSAADRLRLIKDNSYDQSLKQSSTAHLHLKILRKSAGCGTRLVIIGIILDLDKPVERGLSELEHNPFLTHSADMCSTHLKLQRVNIFKKSSFIYAVIIFLLILFPTQARAAVNYRDLGVEQRRTEIKKAVQDKVIPKSDDIYETEKKLITEQLAIITGEEDTRYSIVAGDTVEVSYKDQGREIKKIYQVNDQGQIVMPLIGAVKVLGMNRGQARAFLNAQIGEYIRRPELTVELNTKGDYIVIGAASAGVYELQPNLNVMEAILKAGYSSNQANLGNVLVMRGGRSNPTTLRLNLKKMIRKGDRSDNIPVKPGDLIYIPNTFFYDFEKFKDKVFDYVLDYYTLGGSTILKQETTDPTSENETD